MDDPASGLIDVAHFHKGLLDRVGEWNASSPNKSQSLGKPSRSAELGLDDYFPRLIDIPPGIRVAEGNLVSSRCQSFRKVAYTFKLRRNDQCACLVDEAPFPGGGHVCAHAMLVDETDLTRGTSVCADGRKSFLELVASVELRLDHDRSGFVGIAPLSTLFHENQFV